MKKTGIIFVSCFIFCFLFSARTDSAVVAAGAEVTVKDVEPFAYFCLHNKGPFTQVQEVVRKLIEDARAQNISPAGALIGIYYNSPAEAPPQDLDWEMGFPVTEQAFVQPPLEKKVWTFTQVATALHKGTYETTGETIMKILDWMDVNGYVQAGPVLERYLDMDPSAVKPEDLRTEVWIPVKKK
jgi:effector-binding domain-containing protein